MEGHDKWQMLAREITQDAFRGKSDIGKEAQRHTIQRKKGVTN
jgi:hypothetical protein